jgi:hypothetical protein
MYRMAADMSNGSTGFAAVPGACGALETAGMQKARVGEDSGFDRA